MAQLSASYPAISIIMSVYNGEPYLAEAMDSILAQTVTDFEFIVVDDGSTDGSWGILERYARRDSRVRLGKQDNRGLTQTLNRMIAMAKGRYIARMDADDVALPHRLEQQITFLERRADVVCVGGSFELIDAAGRLLTRIAPPEFDDAIQSKALAGHTSLCHPCVMFRRSAVEAIGGYDESIPTAQDLDLFLKLGEVGSLANLKDPVLKYRVHAQAVSEQKHSQQIYYKQLACERAWERRGIQGEFEATAPWRPGSDRQSRHHFMLKYGWWAFNSQQRWTAILYGLRAISLNPIDISGWKLSLIAMLKPLPHQAMA